MDLNLIKTLLANITKFEIKEIIDKSKAVLKSKAEDAERAYVQALNDARSEASRLLDATKAEMKKELQSAINKADADISVKVDESEKSIADIKKNAVASVDKVARDTAKEIVSALGGKADAKTISLAVSSKIKG